jgi:hypothetical protein
VIDVSLHSAIRATPAAMLEGAIVALPRAASFGRLRQLRSPGWTALLPGSILAGTFGLLLAPACATGLLLISAVSTPVLTGLAIWFVARWRVLVSLIAAASMIASLAGGSIGLAGGSVVTALACVAIGAALSALIPSRWLLTGVALMALCDAVLLATGFGYRQEAVLAAASSGFHGPHFIGARVIGTTIGYPDLCLAALAGSRLADGRDQWWGAGLVFALAAACDSMLSKGTILPATIPIALALATVQWRSRRRVARVRRGRRAYEGNAAAPPGNASGRAEMEIEIGAPGFEPGTSATQRPRATRLRHTPRSTGRV